MTTDTEAREIAARLTKAQRRAVMWLPEDGGRKSYAFNMHGIGIWDVEKMHLATSNYEAVWWTTTPLGLRVRSILAAQEGGQ